MLKWIKSHRLLTIILTLATVGSLYFFLRPEHKDYDSVLATRGGINSTLELSGKVVAATSSNLRFGAGGLVTYLGAKEGDSVKKYQTIASLDSRQLKKTLEQKLNLYSIQRGTFEQTIDDNDNSVPDGDLGRELQRLLAKNQYQLENTVLDVEYLDLSLTLSRLSSPLSGILISAPIDAPGVNVAPTDTWVVVDPSSLYFSADLDETDLSRVKVGQKVTIHLDAYPESSIDSVVSSIAFTPKETSTGTVYELKLALPETEMGSLRLGLNGTANIILEEKTDVVLLPSRAVLFDGGNTSVIKQIDGNYEPVSISIGIENDGQIELSEGVTEGEYVYIEKNLN